MEPDNEMNQLIDRAERDGAEIRSYYQNMTFTPSELRDERAKGRFRWGPVNWYLVSRQKIILELETQITQYEKGIIRMRKKLKEINS